MDAIAWGSKLYQVLWLGAFQPKKVPPPNVVRRFFSTHNSERDTYKTRLMIKLNIKRDKLN